MASRLPLRAHRTAFPGLLLDAPNVGSAASLRTRSGLVGYALDAQPARKTFWTISVWKDGGACPGSPPPTPTGVSTKGLQSQPGPSHFEFFPISGGDLPLDWDEVRRRLEERGTAVNQELAYPTDPWFPQLRRRVALLG